MATDRHSLLPYNGWLPPDPPFSAGIMAHSICGASPFRPHIKRIRWLYESFRSVFRGTVDAFYSIPRNETTVLRRFMAEKRKIFQKKSPAVRQGFFSLYLKASRFASISARSAWEGPSRSGCVSAGTSCIPAIMESRADFAISSTIARS